MYKIDRRGAWGRGPKIVHQDGPFKCNTWKKLVMWPQCPATYKPVLAAVFGPKPVLAQSKNRNTGRTQNFFFFIYFKYRNVWGDSSCNRKTQKGRKWTSGKGELYLRGEKIYFLVSTSEVTRITGYKVLFSRFIIFMKGTDRTFMHLVSVQRVCGSTPLNLTHAWWTTLWPSVANRQ